MPNGKGNGGGGRGGFGRQPGQFETIISTPQKESKLPLQMVSKTIFCNACIFGALTVILLLVGRWWPTVFGLAFTVWSSANLWHDGHPKAAVVLAVILTAISMLVPPELVGRGPGFWYSGQEWLAAAAGWWPLWAMLVVLAVLAGYMWKRKELSTAFFLTTTVILIMWQGVPRLLVTFPQEQVAIHPLYAWLITAWAIVGIVWMVVLPMLLGTYAYGTGAVDPNGPTAPRAATTVIGPILPWTWLKLWREERGAEVERQIEYVTDPVPVTITNGQQALAALGGDGRIAKFVENSTGRMLLAPSGQRVRLFDLVRFIQQGHIVGPTFDAWGANTPRHWKYARWRDVVATLTIFGITEKPQEKVKTRFLVSKEQAMALLVTNLDRPTLQDTVVPTVLGGRITDRTETEQKTNEQEGGAEDFPPNTKATREAG